MSDNRSYEWNDTIENDSSFTMLPEGVYPFTVTKFERARHPGSANLPACNKAVLTLSVDGGTLGKTTITHNLFLHSKCEGFLCEFFTAIGLRKHGEKLQMPWDRVTGTSGTCKVGIRNWTGDDGQERQSNEIKRFLEPTAAPAAPSWQNGQF